MLVRSSEVIISLMLCSDVLNDFFYIKNMLAGLN
jgi:hypothetical protein